MYKKKQLTQYQKETILKAFQAFQDINEITEGTLNFKNLINKHLYELVISYLNLQGIKTSHGKPFNLRRLNQFFQAIRPHSQEVVRLLIEADLIPQQELTDFSYQTFQQQDSLAVFLPKIRAEADFTDDYTDNDFLRHSTKDNEAYIQELYSNLRTPEGGPLYDKKYFRKHVTRFKDLDPII